MRTQFCISEECFFNNGRVLLKSMPEVEEKIRRALSKEGEIEITERFPKNKPSYNGIKADSLNKALRKNLKEENINGETHVENGVFFHKTKEGFDFSIYDNDYNESRLYNYYQGSIGILNGDEKIIDVYKKVGYKKKEWKGKIAAMQEVVASNSDIIREKEILTVAGEIQFGNWALIYRDLFRLLNADANPGIDFYIYISADDKLSKLLSSNTVSFKNANTVIAENLSVVKTPIWSIGLGIKRDF